MKIVEELLSIQLFFQLKAKEMTGEDVEINVADIDTDVNFEVNLNDLARTEGIVSKEKVETCFHCFIFRTLECWQPSLMKNLLH